MQYRDIYYDFLRLRAHAEPWDHRISFVLDRALNGRHFIAKQVATSERVEGREVTEFHFVEHSLGEAVSPSFYLYHEQAQELMNQLWACGLRPKDGQVSEGALTATQRHLEDMRRIAFNALDLPLETLPCRNT